MPNFIEKILEKTIKGIWHCLLFLPSYSPNLKVWADIKKKLKEIAHNFNTLEEAVTSILFDKMILF